MVGSSHVALDQPREAVGADPDPLGPRAKRMLGTFKDRKPDAAAVKVEPQKVAGALLFVGAAQFFVGLLLAEALYPGYNISGNYISDLGAYCPQSNAWTNYAGPCVVHQPTAIIFDSSVFLLGLLVAVAAYLFSRSAGRNVFSILLVLTGVGAMGVGVFPETAPLAHELTSDVAFIFAALAAVWSYRLVKAPLNYFSGILGAVSLAAIVLDEANVTAGLGVGGIERMIVYPVIVWAVGFGAYAMAPGLRVPPGPFPPSAPEWTGPSP